MIAPREEVCAVPIAEHGGRHGLEQNGACRSDQLDFSVCLNAFGPARAVAEAIRAAPVAEYPDPRSVRARRVVAERWRVPTSSIVVGAGSAELIQAVCFAYIRPGDVVLVVEPAFAEYRRAAALCGADVVGVHLQADDDPSTVIREIRQRRPRLVFVASPVNPTGIAIDRETLRVVADACAEVDGLLVLDQAYDAFSVEPLGTPALRDHEAVLHLRSSTKEHALAGVRVAVGVGPEPIIESVERVRVPWATSAAAQAALIATFDDEAQAHASATINQLRTEAARVAAAMNVLGTDVSRSATHYMLIGCPCAAELRDHLASAHGILVRDCTSFGFPGHVRVASRLPSENDRLIHALRQALS